MRKKNRKSKVGEGEKGPGSNDQGRRKSEIHNLCTCSSGVRHLTRTGEQSQISQTKGGFKASGEGKMKFNGKSVYYLSRWKCFTRGEIRHTM